MVIPESQLEIWSHQGSVVQSSATYQIIRNALLASNAVYATKSFDVFLQGSYGHDTNIYAESDVDTVIKLSSIFRGDVSGLPSEQQAAYRQAHRDASYTFAEFKQGVVTRLSDAFGTDNVNPGNKAIKIKANGSRRSSDVVTCYEYRRYTRFISLSDHKYISGIIFPTLSGCEVINYPKLHADNGTTKHQATGNKFKPLVRIFKNMRSKLETDALIEKGVAPSYFIEGLLYNVPNSNFSGSYGNVVFNILKWLHQTTDRSEFICVNEQHYLLRDNDPVCWPLTNAEQFINAVIRLWNNW